MDDMPRTLPKQIIAVWNETLETRCKDSDVKPGECTTSGYSDVREFALRYREAA